MRSVLRRVILKRDKYCCNNCGSKDKLQIHHINGDRGNNVEDNLVTLCQHCHFVIHNHGVGHGKGQEHNKFNPETCLRLFTAILKNPAIPTYKLAKEVGISEENTSKLRSRWELYKRNLTDADRVGFVKKAIWKLYVILENNVVTCEKIDKNRSIKVLMGGILLKFVGSIKLPRDRTMQILAKARGELGWKEGEMIAQFVNKAKDSVVLMRAQDVLSVEEIEKRKKEK